MKQIAIFASFLILTTAGPLSAEMVRYVDEFGKPHYVDTNYSSVPEQYRHQVEAQLKAQKEKDEAKDQPMTGVPAEIGGPLSPAPAAQEKAITLFISKDCQQCMLQAAILQKEGAVFTTLDIETSEGSAEYEKIGKPELPASMVEEEVVLGFNPSRIIALAQGKKLPQLERGAPNKNFVNPFQE